MRLRLIVPLAVVAALIAAAAVTPATSSTATAQTTPGVTLPCSPLGERIELLCTITGFGTNEAGQLTASGTVTNPANGMSLPFADVPITDLSSGPGNSCRILHLQLGPIDLNLLGLRVQTNQIVVDITAERGPGNLLGNLLCGIVGLFDAGLPSGTLAALLNFLLGQ